MLHLSQSTKKYLRYALTGLLVTGMVFVTGFISFTCMLLLAPSIYLALGAFYLAGGIEGEVYAQQIGSSLLKIFSPNYLEDLLLQEKLLELIENLDEENPASQFLLDYKKQLEYLEALEESEDESNREELKSTQKSLKWMRRYFKDFMQNKQNDERLQQALIKNNEKENNEKTNDEKANDEKEAFRKKVRRKLLQGRLSWILNLGAGMCCGLVGLNLAQSGILTLATHFGIVITGAAMSASVIGLAVVGAIGYTLLVHNTITDMIQNETLQKWAVETAVFFKRKPGETNFNYGRRLVLGAVGVGLVVGMAIFATVATAGTWWQAAKFGAKMIPGIRNFANTFGIVTFILTLITTLPFNVVNSLKSLKELANTSIHIAWHYLKNEVQKYRKMENTVQFLNPVRLLILLITFPFKTLTFVGHLISMGVMGNELKGVNRFVTTALCTASEASADYCMIFPGHQHEHHDENEHHGPAEQAHAPRKKHDEHNHTHADLTGRFLKFVLTVTFLYPLAALWDYHFSQKNEEAEKRLKSPWQALKKAWFGLPEKRTIEKPDLSVQWLLIERQRRIKKTIQKYGAGLDQENNPDDVAAIEELTEKIVPAAHSIYRNHDDGKINSNTFFEEHNLSQKGKKVCEKIIEKSNSEQYKSLRVN